jgi:short chain dehydrogenase
VRRLGVAPATAAARACDYADGQAVAVPGDVTSESDLRRVARAAVERFGRIDTWINNAAVFIQGAVTDVGLGEFRRVLDVNLVGYVNGTRCALEWTLPAGRGSIVQVSSMTGRPRSTDIPAACSGRCPSPRRQSTDPTVVAREIARLAEDPSPERVVGAFAQFYVRLPLLPQRGRLAPAAHGRLHPKRPHGPR